MACAVEYRCMSLVEVSESVESLPFADHRQGARHRLGDRLGQQQQQLVAAVRHLFLLPTVQEGAGRPEEPGQQERTGDGRGQRAPPQRGARARVAPPAGRDQRRGDSDQRGRRRGEAERDRRRPPATGDGQGECPGERRPGSPYELCHPERIRGAYPGRGSGDRQGRRGGASPPHPGK